MEQIPNSPFVVFDDVVNDSDDPAFWEKRRKLIEELSAQMDKDPNMIVVQTHHTPCSLMEMAKELAAQMDKQHPNNIAVQPRLVPCNVTEMANQLAKQYEEHAAKRIFP